MKEIIEKNWGWSGLRVDTVEMTNDFGNFIIKADDNKYWRICPDQLYCKIIAFDKAEFEELMKDEKSLGDWEMKPIIGDAAAEVGALQPGEVYCLKLPSVFGGLYEAMNFDKIPLEKLIALTGELAFQIKDMPDGSRIEFDA